MYFAIFSICSLSAEEHIVIVEGPVEVVTSEELPGKAVYWIKDSQNVRYRVVLPEAERARLGKVIKDSPTSSVPFDGTVVNDDEQRVLNVRKWGTITTKTAETDENGNTRTFEKTTTSLVK